MLCSKNRNLKVPFSDFSMNSKQKNMSANFRFFNFCSHSLMHFLDEVYEFGMNFLYLTGNFFVSMLKFTTFGSVLWTRQTRQKIYLSNIKNSSQIYKLHLENALRNKQTCMVSLNKFWWFMFINYHRGCIYCLVCT